MGQAKRLSLRPALASHPAIGYGHLCRYIGGSTLRRQHLARAEPLTTLPRSARSRVSWSLSGCLLRAPPPTSLWDSRTTRSGCARRAIKPIGLLAPGGPAAGSG